MKKLLVGVLVLVVVAVGAILSVPLLVPAERIRDEAVAAVKSATGRDLTIQGKVSVSVFPALAVQVGDVALVNPPGYSSKDLIRLGGVDVRLKLLPLLGGKVEVDSFVLQDPVITLETDRQGRGNWVFDTPAAPPSAVRPEARTPAPSAAPAPAPASAPSSGPSDIALGDVRLVNGRLIQIDGKTGARAEVSEINLQVSLKSLTTPLSAKGDLVWNGKRIGLSLGVDSLKRILGGAESPFAVDLASEPLKLSLTGALKGGAAPAVSGDVDLAVPSVRGLAAWAGTPIALAGTGLGPLSIKGRLEASAARIAFTQAAIDVDAIRSKGELSVALDRAKPEVKGRLDVEMLDLNPYLPPEGGAGSPPARSEAKPAAAPGGSGGSGGSAAQGKSGWSDDPVDASALKAADVDFRLSCGGILVRAIRVGKSAVTIALHDGRLVADLTELALYRGAGKGRVVLDGSQPGVGLDAALQVKEVQAEPFLSDVAGSDRLSGTANADIAVTGRGKSQRQIVSSLDGKGAVSFLNGAVKGINLAAMVRNVATAFMGGGSSSEKTDFAELGGTFTIAKGLVRNNDLALKSPLLRIEGKGVVDLPQRSLDYRVDPKLVASLQGQGGGNAAGLVVPVLVSGPWDNLTYRPDLEALVKQNVQNIGNTVGDVVGGGVKAVTGETPSSLNPLKLFGR